MRPAMGDRAIRTRRWTRQEYDRLIELGVLHEDEPLELLDGRLVVREPQRTPHAVATQLVEEALRVAFGTGWSVRVQLPLALDADSEPEPDVAVVQGAPRDHLREHPRPRSSWSRSRTTACERIESSRDASTRARPSRTIGS